MVAGVAGTVKSLPDPFSAETGFCSDAVTDNVVSVVRSEEVAVVKWARTRIICVSPSSI